MSVAHAVVARRLVPGAASLGDPSSGDFTYSVVEHVASERRAERRQRTRLREAMLGLRRGHVLVECRIRDRSRRGARLRLDAPCPLPKLFILTDAASRARFHASLVWQSGRDAGVRLTPVPAA